MIRSVAAAAILAILLTGCGSVSQWWHNGGKVGPDYCPPPAPVADHWVDAANHGVRSQPADDALWWTVFGDEDLDRLVEAAYRQNLSLRVAGLRILEARAHLGIAEGNLFPQQQQMSAQYSRHELSRNAFPFELTKSPPFNTFPIRNSYDDWSVGFNAAWELDFWGQFRRGIEAADATLNAQVENYDDVLVLLQSDVAANYIQMRSLQRRIVLTQENLDLQRKTLALVELRFNKGLVTELDVDRARANVSSTEALIPTFEIALRRAQNRLCILLGMPPCELCAMVRDSAAIPVAPDAIVAGIPADLLRRRPDVRRAEREAAAESARIGIAEAEFYPHIAITGQIGWEAENVSALFRGDSLAATVGPGFHWNILNYGRIRNSVRAQEARFRAAVITYQETVLKANEEADSAIAAFVREGRRADSLEAAATSTQQAVSLAILQYEKGFIDYQPVLETQRDLVRQQDAVAESRGQVAVNLVAAYKALAGGWQMRLAPPPASPAVPAEVAPWPDAQRREVLPPGEELPPPARPEEKR